MAEYHNLKELGNKTLKEDDIVIFDDLTYEVNHTHLYCPCYFNDAIFDKLCLDKHYFCSKHYGYKADIGCWPACKRDNYKALTRVVKALYEIIEGKAEISKKELILKVGDTVRVKSRDWYDANKDKYGSIKYASESFVSSMAEYCGVITTIEEIDINGACRLKDCDTWDFPPETLEKVDVQLTAPISDYEPEIQTTAFTKSSPPKLEDLKALFNYNDKKSSNKIKCSSEFKFTINKSKKVFF